LRTDLDLKCYRQWARKIAKPTLDLLAQTMFDIPAELPQALLHITPARILS